MRRTQVYTNQDNSILKKERIFFSLNKTLWYFLLIKRYGINTALRKMCLLIGTDFQVSDVANGPLVFLKECILNFNTFFFNFSLGSNKQLSFLALVVLSSLFMGIY